MIPADTDIADLSGQLADNRVAIGAVAEEYPTMEGELAEVMGQAEAEGFGATGIALLDHTPEQPADLRDIAQELLMAGELDTVIVRAPASGAIVSDIHSRAEIESAQWRFLGDSDYVAATRTLIDEINSAGISWGGVTALALLALLVVVVLAAVAARSTRFRRG